MLDKGKQTVSSATTIDQATRPNESKHVSELNNAQIIETATRETLPLPVTCLILCGGRSKRMGRPKAFLPFANRTIIEHLIETVKDIFSETFLVANEPDGFSHLSVDVVKDILPYRGPLGGIFSGLLVAAHQHSFVIACDMPLVSKKLIRQMTTKRHEADVVVLSHKGNIEPLLGIYAKSCIKPLEESLFSGKLTVADFLAGLKAKTFEYQPAAEKTDELPPFFNVNTPQDYSEILTKTLIKGHPVNLRDGTSTNTLTKMLP